MERNCPTCKTTLKVIDIILAGHPLRGTHRQIIAKCPCCERQYTYWAEVNV